MDFAALLIYQRRSNKTDHSPFEAANPKLAAQLGIFSPDIVVLK